MLPFAFLGLAAGDLWWVAASAFVAAFAGWFAIKTRMGMTWVLNKARRGFVDWFGESIDTHVRPKFDEIRAELAATAEQTQQNSLDAARAIKDEAINTAHAVRDKMLATAMEVKAALGAHQEADEAIVEASARALRAGQGLLISRIDEHHDELVALHTDLTAKVEEHITADEVGFAEVKDLIAERDDSE